MTARKLPTMSGSVTALKPVRLRWTCQSIAVMMAALRSAVERLNQARVIQKVTGMVRVQTDRTGSPSYGLDGDGDEVEKKGLATVVGRKIDGIAASQNSECVEAVDGFIVIEPWRHTSQVDDPERPRQRRQPHDGGPELTEATLAAC